MTDAVLNIEWGERGLNSAIDKGNRIVIIGQLRFSSAVVTAVALGFVIEPTSDKSRKSESFSLSPFSFFDKSPQRVVIRSPNGAHLSINAKKARCVVYGSLLNAGSIGEWINKENEIKLHFNFSRTKVKLQFNLFPDLEMPSFRCC